MKTRLLIIASSAMNEVSSNGRTLKDLLLGFNDEESAQLYFNSFPNF